jgi:hypothetical protein
MTFVITNYFTYFTLVDQFVGNVVYQKSYILYSPECCVILKKDSRAAYTGEDFRFLQ